MRQWASLTSLAVGALLTASLRAEEPTDEAKRYLGRPIMDFLNKATSGEIYRVVTPAQAKLGMKVSDKIAGYPVSNVVKMGKNRVAAIRYSLFRTQFYERQPGRPKFAPLFLMRFQVDKETLVLVYSYASLEMEIIYTDRTGTSRRIVDGEYDILRSTFVTAAKDAFPTDEILGEMETMTE